MILHTIMMRPYVVLFLITFLILSSRSKGWRFTLTFLITGYVIAWLSEFLSINYGFPYGWYFYIYENMAGEWLNNGVPVWDSISYPFLCYAALALVKETCPGLSVKKQTLLAAFLTMLLDVVIDPIAHMGGRWFLGKIYYYPNPGFYFDIPLSNFAGWFLVAFLIIGLNLKLDRSLKWATPSPLLEGTLFYFAIFLFNWAITLYLQEWFLALISLGWMAFPGALVYRFYKNSKRSLT